MRIWHSYGSEHSMDLVLVGTFSTISEAEGAVEKIEALQAVAEALGASDSWDDYGERMPNELLEALKELKLYTMGRSDIDNFAYDHNAERDHASVRLWTDETEIQGFMKVLLELGARVEVFSRHHWNEDGTARLAEGE